MKWNGSTNVQSFNVVSSEMVRTNKFQISVRTSPPLSLSRKMKNVRRDRMRGTIKRNRNKTVILDSTHNPSRTPCFSVSWEPSNFWMGWDGMEADQHNINIPSTVSSLFSIRCKVQYNGYIRCSHPYKYPYPYLTLRLSVL